MRADTRQFYEAAVTRAAEHLAAHLDDQPELDALARLAGLSPYHFHRIFRGLLGETPHGFHRRLRLERAAWRLGAEPTPVTDIAFDAGYETHESFTRAFRKAYGHSPSAWRRAAPTSVGAHGPLPFIDLRAPSGVHFHPSQGATPLVFRAPGALTMDVTIETHPARRLAAMRHVGPFNQIGQAFGRLMAIAGRAGLMGQPGVECIALYHDDPESTAPDTLRSDACLSLPEGAATPEGLTEVVLPGGRHACGLHRGSYAGLGEAWAKMYGEWLPQSGEEVADAIPFEVYLNDSMDVAPEALRTLICVPLR